MKTVKEIRDFKVKYKYMAINAQNIQNLNQFVFDVLIGITEHLTAQQLAIPRAFGPLINPDDERRGMIAALRWVRNDRGPKYPVMPRDTHQIDDAIARLENGGDL
jgi:hypothetical protein